MDTVNKLKEIILDNNWFDTPSGERFKEMYGITGVEAVMTFAGRSKRRCSYLLSESDEMYVTHLYIDAKGDVCMQLSSEDTDDYSLILRPSGESVEDLDEEILDEWLELLDI